MATDAEKMDFVVDGLKVPSSDMRAIRMKYLNFKKLSAFEDRALKEFFRANGDLPKISNDLGFDSPESLWKHWSLTGERYVHPLIRSGVMKFDGPETETVFGRKENTPDRVKESAQRRTRDEIKAPTFKAQESSLNRRMTHGTSYTKEQSDIIFGKEHTMKVLAFAGTGKSTTLRGLAIENLDKKILYIVFNKAAAESAKLKMPSNVTVKTQDALAYGAVINTFRAKNEFFAKQGRSFPSVSVRDVAKAENLNPTDAKAVLDTVTSFFLSEDTQIQQKHLPVSEDEKSKGQAGSISASLSEAKSNEILRLALRVANKIVSPTDRTYPCTFQGMMKVYQFQYPILDAYDLILVDEAQDINEVFSSIIANQALNNKRSRLVVVGDSHQNIYAFRGAKDFLPEFKAEKTYTLSNSFRYGRGIALLASHILSRHKNEPVRVTGLGRQPITNFTIDYSKQYAVISRTNAELLDQVIRAVSAGKSVHFLGGLSKYKFEPIEDAYKLFAGGRATSHDLKSFYSWEEFSEFASKSKDPNLRAIQRVVSEHKHNTLNVIAAAKASSEENREIADVIVSTAHSCKGDEFDQVLMTDDFASLWSEEDPTSSTKDKQEVNLIYMAVTRALKAIQLPSLLIDDCARDGVTIDLINHCQVNDLPYDQMKPLAEEVLQGQFRSKSQRKQDKPKVDVQSALANKGDDAIATESVVDEPEQESSDDETFDEIEDTLLKMLSDKL